MKKLLLSILFTSIFFLVNAQTPAACFHLNALNTPNVGSSPYTIGSGDLNGDGIIDLVVPNYFSNNVSVLLGAGLGTYVSAVNYATGSRPFGVCVADFNNDGKLDIAASNEQGANVSILIGSGTGTFSAPSNYGVGSNPYIICSADFNGDGKADLATANYVSNNVSILLGSGTGTFAAAVNYVVGTNPTCVIPVDLNNDGKIDLAISNTSSNNMSVLMGSGTGTFAAAVNYAVGTGPYLMSSADFNGDGKADLGVANFSSSNVSVLLGSASGTLAAAVNYAVGGNATSVNAADFNGDGNVDLAVVLYASNNVKVLLGSGAGVFALSGNFAVGTNPWGSCTADLDGDGKPDLATSNLTSNNVSILLNGVPGLTVTSSNTLCAGTNFTLAASGANTYSWSTTSTASNIVVSPTLNTTYNLIGTSTGGCTNTAVRTLTVNALPTLTITPSGTVACSGKTVTLTASGASTYLWDNSATTASTTVSPVVTGNFTVTGTSVAGCTASAVRNISVNALPNVTITPSSSVICVGKTSTLTAGGASTYFWNTGPSTSTISVSPGTNTSYTVTGTAAATGCSNTAVQSVSVNALPILSITPSSTAICIGTSATLNASGAMSFVWNTGPATFSISVSPISTTGYTVTGMDATTTCSNTTTQTIVVNSLPTVTITPSSTVICDGKTATLTAGGASTYVWDNSATTVSTTVNPSTTTSFTVVGTSAVGCTNTAVRSISVNSLPSVSVTPVSTVLCAGKTTTITASGANTYTWAGGPVNASIAVTPSVSTDYTVTGRTTVTGCSNTAIQSISVNALPALIVTPTSSVLCFGQSSTLTASGATSYLWNNASTSLSIIVSPTTTTNYTVNGTDALTTCSINVIQTVSVNALPVLTITPSSTVICFGKTATLTGTGAETWLWSDASTTSMVAISPTNTTTYSVVGTSTLTNCSNSAVRSISVNILPTLTVTPSTTVICYGKLASLAASGASTYTWNTNSTNTTVVVSPTVNGTTYTVTGTAALTGCSNTAVQSISVNPLPSMTITATSTVLCAGKAATLTVSGADSYFWSILSTTNTQVVVFPNYSLNYTVTGTDALTTCSTTAVKFFSVNALPPVPITVASPVICDGLNATLSTGGASSYTWEPGTLSTITITPSPSVTTTYTLVGTAAVSGCTNQAVKTISVNTTPTVTLSSNTPSICVGANAVITATGANTYTLLPGNVIGNFFTVSPLASTQYTVIGKNTLNCYNLIPANSVILVNALTSIRGTVISPTINPVSGNVVLYKYKPYLSHWDSITSSLISSSLYNFTAVPSGTYVVKAFPFQTDMLETYASASASWQSALLINHHCIMNDTVNINVIQIQNSVKGNASMSGKITRGAGYWQGGTSGSPIPGILVKCGTYPSGVIAQRASTDAQGQYTLANLTTNLGTQHYYILVDIPGLDTNKTYHRIIVTGFENFVNLDFIVDSAKITPVRISVGVQELTLEKGQFSVFPNPANTAINIQCELKTSGEISMELTDINGRSVKTLLAATVEERGNVLVLADVSDVSPGVYFVKIKMGDEHKTIKLVIAK